jgi:CheY-like chemotaxis protein
VLTGTATATAQREDARTDRIRLLLVDDSRDNLVSLEATLQGLADELVCAQSGTEVLRHMLENDDFAAILLDVKMPEMDGFEIAELIRTRRSARHTPILFLTAYRSDDHLFRGYDLGAVDFLFKPIVPEILRSKVSVFIDLARNVQMLKRQREVSVRAEQKFRSLLEAAPDATFITRADGRIMLVNTPGCDLFGYVTHELLDQNLTDLIPRWRQGCRLRPRCRTPEQDSIPGRNQSEPAQHRGRSSNHHCGSGYHRTEEGRREHPRAERRTGAPGGRAHGRINPVYRSAATVRLGSQPRPSGAAPDGSRIQPVAPAQERAVAE